MIKDYYSKEAFENEAVQMQGHDVIREMQTLGD